jgi:cyclomaltodextrinase
VVATAAALPRPLDPVAVLDGDAKVFGLDGSLVPRAYRFEPGDAAHVSRTADGVRFRLVTEPDVVDARVTFRTADGATSHAMEREVDGETLVVWSATVPVEGPTEYSLAFLDDRGRAVYLTPSGFAGAVERLDTWSLEPARVPLIDTPAWALGTVMYQIFPDRFANADPATDPEGVDPWGSEPRRDGFQGGDLDGIVAHLDHLERLGVETIYLNPVVTSPSNHRYDASDYHHVDPILGGDEAFDRLRSATRARGIRLVVDLSINHCHPQHEAFRSVRDLGPESPYWAWFKVTEWPLRVRYRPQSRPPGFDHFTPADARRFGDETGIPFVTDEGDGPFIETTYDSWYGVPSMPRFDLTNPETRAYLLDVGRHWLTRFDADGIRMDVARYIELEVWREARPRFRAAKGDAYLLCEIFGEATPWLQGDTFDGVMNYIGQDLLRSFVVGEITGGEFSSGVERMLAAVTPEAGLASQLLLGSHDVPRFLTAVGGDRAGLELATFLQFLLPGSPSVYYGDEVYLDGGHDPECRKAFPWGAEADAPLVDAIGELAALRRSSDAVRVGRWRPISHGVDWLAFERSHLGQSVIVVANRGDQPVTLGVAATRVVLGPGRLADGVLTVPGGGGVVVA